MSNSNKKYYQTLLCTFTLLIVNCSILIGQEAVTEEFSVGSFVTVSPIENPRMYKSFASTGLNYIWQRADENTKRELEPYNLIVWNSRADTEYIYHYSSCYYSKWEAEQDQKDPERIGIKHGLNIGKTAFWKGIKCWSTEGLTSPTSSLMYGPHYRQDKKYKRWYSAEHWEDTVYYGVRFKMALSNSSNVSKSENVCVIKVVYTYKEVISQNKHRFHDRVLLTDTLNVEDFDASGNFKYFDFNGKTYNYFPLPKNINYTEIESYTGIQFCVDWLRRDSRCLLYIDNVEVFDNDGWNKYLENPKRIESLILNYAKRYTSWPNLKFWGGVDEPSVLDAFTPVHIVDSLIQSVGAPPLINTFNPTWTWDHLVNGEIQMKQFVEMARPQKLFLAVNPCDQQNQVLTFNQYDWLRHTLQLASGLDPNFWFVAQTHGLLTRNNDWCTWRKPKPNELKSMVMLALAHGAKGIQFMWFNSYVSAQDNGVCSGINWEAIVDENGRPIQDNQNNSIYYLIKDNLVPRLKGILGKTLDNLEYTGKFIQILKDPVQPINNYPSKSDFLSLTSSDPNYYFHAGLLKRKYMVDDKYFMLINLNIGKDQLVTINITNEFGVNNLRIKNVEAPEKLDVTVNKQYSTKLLIPSGEGYLFQVSPVIKFGGKLLYSEETKDGMELIEEMTIENGAILTVNGNYYSKENIIIKNGRVLYKNNGKIHFAENKKIIIN